VNNLVTKLSAVAALIGVIGAIGAGFVQYGKLTAKIEELDERKAVINQTVDLEPLQEKISVLEVKLIDRIKKVDDKIVTVDLSGIKEDIIDLKGRSVNLKPLRDSIKELEAAIKGIETRIAELNQAVAIVQKENQLQDILIEEIKTKANNPLAN
jgi:phage terminase large subunit-like protein